MNLRFLLLLISFIVRSVQSIPVDLIVEKQTDNYTINIDLTSETEEKSCQNGGLPIGNELFDDWSCGCPPNFAGRYCEVKIKSQSGCGTKIILFKIDKLFNIKNSYKLIKSTNLEAIKLKL